MKRSNDSEQLREEPAVACEGDARDERAPVEKAPAENSEQEPVPQGEQEPIGEGDGDGGSTEELRRELDAAGDKYMRLMAEFDNYKRRTAREYERLVETANEGLMRDIVEVRENFARALKNNPEEGDAKAFVEGIRLIFNKFDEQLRKNGLEPFAQEGEEFDPQLHDALMKTPHDEIPEGHICDIFEKGYRLRGHVLKHARVVVSAGVAQSCGESS